MLFMRASIRLNYVQWFGSLVRQWLTRTMMASCNIVAHSLEISFIFSLFSLLLFCSISSWVCRIGCVYVSFSLSLYLSRFARQIEFISIHLFFYWIFYFRSIRVRCVVFFFCIIIVVGWFFPSFLPHFIRKDRALRVCVITSLFIVYTVKKMSIENCRKIE